jgi:hypothetical protein
MRAGPYTPKCIVFVWARAVVFQIANVPVSHSDEVPGGTVPGVLPVYTVDVHDLARRARRQAEHDCVICRFS